MHGRVCKRQPRVVKTAKYGAGNEFQIGFVPVSGERDNEEHLWVEIVLLIFQNFESEMKYNKELDSIQYMVWTSALDMVHDTDGCAYLIWSTEYEEDDTVDVVVGKKGKKASGCRRMVWRETAQGQLRKGERGAI